MKEVRQLYLVLSCELKWDREREKSRGEGVVWGEENRGEDEEKEKKQKTYSGEVRISKHRWKLLNVW